MSHRSRRSDDRDRSHKHGDRSDHYSRDRSDHYSYSGRSRYRSRSRSNSRSYSRHHSSHHHSRSHRSKDYRESPEPKLRHDSRHDHHQSKYGTASDSKIDKKYKHDASNELNESGGPKNISSHQQNVKNYNSGSDTGTNDEPTINAVGVSVQDAELEKEKERIQREAMERLQRHFEKEGKAYPPPKPQASHPVYANDGSFLEIFKRTVQQQQQQQQSSVSTSSSSSSSLLASAAAISAATSTAIAPNESQTKPTISTAAKTNTVIPVLPVKRRGAKILKTGIVQKQRIVEEVEDPQPADSWNAYLKEVKRYKTVTCSDDNMTRSLVK